MASPPNSCSSSTAPSPRRWSAANRRWPARHGKRLAFCSPPQVYGCPLPLRRKENDTSGATLFIAGAVSQKPGERGLRLPARDRSGAVSCDIWPRSNLKTGAK